LLIGYQQILQSKKLKKVGILKQSTEKDSEFIETKSALNGAVKQFTKDGKPGYDQKSFMNYVKNKALKVLESNKNNNINFTLTCTMEKVDLRSGEIKRAEVPFHTKQEPVLESTDISEIYENAIDKIEETLQIFQNRGSNWRFASVLKFEINTFRYEPLKGKSYIPLPKALAEKKAIINMKNEDDKCFKWAVTRALNPIERDGERVTKILKLQSEKLNWEGIEFPTTLNQVKVFKRRNNISVNVFGYEKEIYPLYHSALQSSDKTADLLLISDGDKSHYCVIKSLSRLLATQTSNHGQVMQNIFVGNVYMDIIPKNN
jgi:hypothetical protein